MNNNPSTRSARVLFLLLSVAVLPACCASSSLHAGVPETLITTQQEGTALQAKAKKTLTAFKPEVVFTNYSATLPQTHYYAGVKAGRASGLDKAAGQALETPLGKTVLNSALAHPHFEVSAPDNVDALVNTLLTTYPDCHAKQRCHTTYTTASCLQSPLGEHPSCRKALVVSVLPAAHNEQTVTVEMRALPHHGWQSKATLTVDLTSGQAVSSDASVTVQVVPQLKMLPCEGLEITEVALPAAPDAATLEVLEPPSCLNHFQARVSLAASGRHKAALQASLRYRIQAHLPPQVQESWSSGCGVLESLQAQGICQPEALDVCVKGQATHTIDGQAITRPCWTKESTYRCFQGQAPTSTCQNLLEKGCEQINSTCQTKVGEACAVYQQTYRCPEKTCVNTPEVICGDEILCLKGDCGIKPTPAPSQDFERGASALSATTDASQQFDGATIFKGRPQTCRDAIGEFSDCCNKEGWGQNLHLAHCSQDEKALALSRQQGLAVEVGRYCAEHLPWPLEHVCIEHKQSYCVFPSKLARILQTQGRQKQLGRGFGSGDSPDCSGITPEALQRIDLAKINFQEIYAELTSNLTTPDRLQAIQDRIVAFQRQGMAHD